ncbi:MAG: ATP-grasp domain-containing protein, partial [Polyangiales bacterium]
APETIDAIVAALAREGHEIDRIDVTGPASRVVARLEAFSPDLVFNTAEGRRGRMRRAFYPQLFDELGLPATGSDPYALAITLDKALTKKVLLAHGVPSPQGRLMTGASLHAGGLDELVYPVMVKPNYEGSSKGIGPNAVAEDPVQLARLVEELAPTYTDLLVERYVPGVDVAVAFVEGAPGGNPILEPVELVIDPSYPRRYDVLDFELKHHASTCVHPRVPGELTRPIVRRLRDLAARVISALDLRDAATLDFRVGRDGEVYFLSATANPSLEQNAVLALAAAHAGLTYDALVHTLLRTAAKRQGLAGMLDGAKARVASRKRTSLRVGLAYNLKRVDVHEGDDAEAEYDSPRTIEALTRAIESYGHQVTLLEATPDFPRTLMQSNVDLVFNIAEGIRGRNREAQVPSLCELLAIPYTGSDSATLSICLDKGLGKRILAQNDIETPRWQVLVTGKEKLKALRYPVIVKPNAEGTSKGISTKSVVDDEAGVRAAARELIERYSQPALVEEYIEGREFTVGLLGERRPRIMPPMEVIFLKQKDRPVYDFACKQDWESHVKYVCPAEVTKDELRAIEKICRATFMALDCRDVARIDLRMNAQGRLFVIEVNPLPGLTPDYSDLCLIANGAKVDYRTLIGEILSGGIKRLREQRDGRGDSSPAPPAVHVAAPAPVLAAVAPSQPAATTTSTPPVLASSEKPS